MRIRFNRGHMPNVPRAPGHMPNEPFRRLISDMLDAGSTMVPCICINDSTHYKVSNQLATSIVPEANVATENRDLPRLCKFKKQNRELEIAWYWQALASWMQCPDGEAGCGALRPRVVDSGYVMHGA